MKTEAEVRSFLQQKREIEDLIIDIASEVVLNDNDRIKTSVTLAQMRRLYTGYDIDLDEIQVNFEEYVCGDTDYYSTTFPISYLWTPDAVELDRQTKLEARRVREEQERVKREQEQKEKENLKLENERKMYERLKKKFEGNDEN